MLSIFLPLGFHAIFAITMVGFRVTGRLDASQRMTRYLLASLPLFLALGMWLLPWAEALYSLLVYVWFHYCVFVIGFGVFRRSFTINVLTCLRDANRPLTLREITSQFASGAGIEVVKKVRVEAMERNQHIRIEGAEVVLMPIGVWMVSCRIVLQRLFRMSYVTARSRNS